MLLSLSDYSFFWSHLKDGHFYDTLSLSIFITLFIVCLYVDKIKIRWFLSTTITLVFVVFTIIGWQFKLPIYEKRTSLDKDIDLLLEKHSGGALSNGFLNVSILEGKYFLFEKHTVIKSYDNINTGVVITDKNYVYLTLISYDGRESTDRLNVNEIINTH